jgi:5'-3' exonuclease/transcription antitermination factor NusG
VTWVVLELSPRSEGEDPDVIRKALTHSLKGATVFIPVAVTQRGEDRVITYLMEGYAFVKLDRPPHEYFRLEGSKYVQTILALPGANSRQRKLSTVTDDAVEQMREQIRLLVDQGISVGDLVRITSGPYRSMEARVVEEFPDQGLVQVHVTLRSKQSLVTLPRAFLTVVSRAPLSHVSNRLVALRNWAQAALPVIEWSASVDDILCAYTKYARLEEWRAKCAVLYDVLSLDTAFPKPLWEADRKLKQATQVDRWDTRLQLLYSFIGFQQGSLPEEYLRILHGKVIDLLWVDNLLERIRLLWEDVEAVSRALAQKHEGKDMVQNVIVDGHNLAFRCHFAPGMNTLVDAKGRPSGMILGFLRSLGSLKKRFPDATLYVTWDGSSKRRRSRFSEYKAQRNTPDLSDSIKVLREIIPFFGVRQAWNPDEEADDVIASLTRVDLVNQRNVLFSTDKDLLQLVTETTSLLVPAVGSRNEVLFDAATVVESVGVPPHRVVQLRAFYGDTSDNIPGVPRVPKKVLRALIQAHGSVDAVYQSGLTGLTKGQYERLRSAEPQVRINVDLMSLVDVGVTLISPDVDPDSAAALLSERDIHPEALLQTFFSRYR